MLTLRLPYEHTVLAFLTNASGERFALVRVETNAHHPFATYMVGPAGDCVSGDYCVTEPEARASLLDRAGWERLRVRV